MESIKIIATGSYLPEKRLKNEELNRKFELEDNWIEKRTGIKTRYIAEEEIEDLAIKSVKNLINKSKFDIQKIDCIIVATTSSNKLMPGISYLIQKEFDIKKCMCMDILAGCSGYINAFDIIRKYIACGEIEYGLVVGVEKLSEYINYEDINTAILLGDGAGATLIGKSMQEKKYFQNFESVGHQGEILICNMDNKLYMDGKSIYKFGITKTVENIKELLEKGNETIENIDFIVPHQSNIRILEKMQNKLEVLDDKMYINIKDIGNTFNASIPICLDEMYEKGLIKENQKLILIGYGGGLNLGSILIEV